MNRELIAMNLLSAACWLASKIGPDKYTWDIRLDYELLGYHEIDKDHPVKMELRDLPSAGTRSHDSEGNYIGRDSGMGLR